MAAAVDNGDSNGSSGQRSMAADACFQWQGDDSSVVGSSNRRGMMIISIGGEQCGKCYSLELYV